MRCMPPPCTSSLGTSLPYTVTPLLLLSDPRLLRPCRIIPAHARTARVIGPHHAAAHASESALRTTACSGPFASARAAPVFHLHNPLCFAPAAPPAPPRSCSTPPARTAPALAPATPRPLPAFALTGSALVRHQLPRACAAPVFTSPCFNATRTALALTRCAHAPLELPCIVGAQLPCLHSPSAV
jgi:hypothetical protein